VSCRIGSQPGCFQMCLRVESDANCGGSWQRLGDNRQLARLNKESSAFKDNQTNRQVAMAYYNPQQQQQQQQPYGNAQNLQFYPSSYSNQTVSGTSTPFQAFNSGAQTSAYPSSYGAGFGGQSAVSGRMGEQGGLTMGWLAAFGTEGYPGEPPLLEELGVNFGHIKTKVCESSGTIRYTMPMLMRCDRLLLS
jgi:hypothetical protein